MIKEAAMALTAFVLLAVSMLSPGDDQGKESAEYRRDMAALQGTWKVVNREGTEGKLDKKFLEMVGFRWKFDGTRFYSLGNFQGFNEVGSSNDVSSFSIDADAKPKTMDIRWMRGKMFTVEKCIYELNGDRLRICQNPHGEPGDPESKRRPKSFEPERGTHDTLYEFERVVQRALTVQENGDAKKDLDRMQGSWRVVSSQVADEKASMMKSRRGKSR